MLEIFKILQNVHSFCFIFILQFFQPCLFLHSQRYRSFPTDIYRSFPRLVWYHTRWVILGLKVVVGWSIIFRLWLVVAVENANIVDIIAVKLKWVTVGEILEFWLVRWWVIIRYAQAIKQLKIIFYDFFRNLKQFRKNKIIFEISDKHYDCLYKKIFIKICRSKIAQFGPNSLLTSLCPVQLKHWDWVPHERPWLQQHSLWLICVSEKFNKDFKKACFIFE